MPAEIDRGIGALEGARHLVGIGDVAFDEIDLAHRAQRAQEEGAVGMAHGDLMRQPARASARTVWRPRKPEPPKTVTRLVFMSSDP